MVQAAIKPEQTTGSPDPTAAAGPLVVQFPSGLLTDELLLAISGLNDFWCFERNAEGALEISVPTGSVGGRRSLHLSGQLYIWWAETQDGTVFDSSTGFRLPSSAVRSPDAAWASGSLLENTKLDDEGFWPICPELIVELRSVSQSAEQQQAKMQEWMASGARLGWLIDVYTGEGEVWVYRQGDSEPERLERPDSLSGEAVAEGLIVDLTRVWR